MVEELSTDRGRLRLERPLPGLVLTRVEGFATIELGARLIAWVDAALDDAEVPVIFHDWELAAGYDPALRPRFTAWYLGVRQKVRAVHVLARSKLVTMGVSLVSMATGNDIFAYRERQAFSRAFEAALLEARVNDRRRADTGS